MSKDDDGDSAYATSMESTLEAESHHEVTRLPDKSGYCVWNLMMAFSDFWITHMIVFGLVKW